MPKTDPLWLRAIKSPEAKAWLRKHRNEFPTESFLPDRIAYKDKIVLAREKVAAVIADGMPYTDPKTQELAELVLQVPPRQIAKKLRLSRREVYLRIRALKRLAIRKWQVKRDAEILARGPRARAADTSPLRTIKFATGDREQFAYEVQVGKQRVWLDSERKRFTPEIQELLNHLDDHADAFQLLEVENRGA